MTKRGMAITREVGVVGATAAVMTGATFAALQSQVTLADNTISTTTASLRIWNGTGFATTAPGFKVTDLIPGQWSTPQNFSFRNDGGVPLTLTATVPRGSARGQLSGVAPEDVQIRITDLQTGEARVTTLHALNDGQVQVDDVLPAGAAGSTTTGGNTEGTYSYEVRIDGEDISGSSAQVGPFYIVFTGTQTTGTGTGGTRTPAPDAGANENNETTDANGTPSVITPTQPQPENGNGGNGTTGGAGAGDEDEEATGGTGANDEDDNETTEQATGDATGGSNTLQNDTTVTATF